MNIQEQITDYINTQTEAKRTEMQILNERILQLIPECKLWFLDGKDENGKIVSNPNIGYGNYTIKYADGTSKEFFQIGVSANTTGLSVYIMGIEERKYLPETYAEKIGKATVTGYCIKFKSLKDININILEEAILDGIKQIKLQ